jgi:flagellin-like hook-associated protein FlgL
MRSDGTSFGVDVNGANTVQDVINAINAADGGAGVTASFAATGNGIVLTDTAGGAGTLTVTPVNGASTAKDLGIGGVAAVGNVITGTDANAPSVEGVFASLAKLRDALHANDANGITEAGTTLDLDQKRVVRVRGETGARVQEMEARQSRLEDQNVSTKTLLSSLSDTDFTEAVTRFQTLQTALQATMRTSGQILNLSLMDFLR